MSNPIMMIRKFKNSSQAKLDIAEDSSQKLNSLGSEDVRVSLSKSFGGSQSRGGLKKSRSSSLLKQKLGYASGVGSTPMNKKIRNQSHLMGNMSDMLEITNKKKKMKKAGME